MRNVEFTLNLKPLVCYLDLREKYTAREIGFLVNG